MRSLQKINTLERKVRKMVYKVHWIVDGVAEIEADSKEDAEKKLQESLEDYVKNSKPLMDKFYAKSIQGTAYLPVSYTHLTLPTICSV